VRHDLGDHAHAVGQRALVATDAPTARPKAGKVEILSLDQVKPGMKGVAWTVFQGTEPEAVPIEIIGRWKDMWGPKQDVIIAKMGGKGAAHQRRRRDERQPGLHRWQAGGRVALRLSTFSPDAICGITPIQSMLEIKDLDQSRPDDSRTPSKPAPRNSQAAVPGELLGQIVAAGG
jgi:hypothetical protein